MVRLNASRYASTLPFEKARVLFRIPSMENHDTVLNVSISRVQGCQSGMRTVLVTITILQWENDISYNRGRSAGARRVEGEGNADLVNTGQAGVH